MDWKSENGVVTSIITRISKKQKMNIVIRTEVSVPPHLKGESSTALDDGLIDKAQDQAEKIAIEIFISQVPETAQYRDKIRAYPDVLAEVKLKPSMELTLNNSVTLELHWIVEAEYVIDVREEPKPLS